MSTSLLVTILILAPFVTLIALLLHYKTAGPKRQTRNVLMLVGVLGVSFGLLDLIGHLESFADYLPPPLRQSIKMFKCFVGGIAVGMFLSLLICGQLKLFLHETSQ